MKTIIMLILFFGCMLPIQSCIGYENLQDLLKEEHGLSGDQFCNYVYRRYYFVKRLHNTMLLFLDVESRIDKNGYKAVQLDGLFDFTDQLIFRDMRIQRSIDVMQQKRSLKPLFMIWEDFTGYKSIKDQIFVEEFTKEVSIISRNMLITLAAHDEFVVVPPVRVNPTTEQLLNDIDVMTQMIRSISFGATESSKINKQNENRAVDLHTFAHIDEVAMRYYLIKRLKLACTQLESLEYRRSNIQVRGNSIVWHHPLIISCMHVMEQSQSIEPLIALWDDVLQYKHVQDDLFMHEFVQLVFVTYADIAAYYHEKKPYGTKDPIATAIELYQLIDKLPLHEILDVIDIITHDLPPLLAKYEFDSDMTWRAWFRKYWWTPPLIVATIAIHVLLNWETKNALTPANPEDIPLIPPAPIQPPSSPSSNERDLAWLTENDLFF